MRTLSSTPAAVPAHPDFALPGLEQALDARALGRELLDGWDDADGAPPDPATGRVFYVRYKPGTSLLTGFRYRRAGAPPASGPDDHLSLDNDGLPADDILGYARLLPHGRFAEAESAARAVALRRNGTRLLSRPAAGLLLHLFPFDRALVGLRTLARRGPLKRWATARLPWPEPGGRVSGSASAVSLLRYKPERRAVFSADLGWETAARDRRERHAVILKSHAPGEGLRAQAVMQYLHDAAPERLRLARPLHWCAEERILAQSRLAGDPLFAPPPEVGPADIAEFLGRQGCLAGEALSHLQSVPVRGRFAELAGGFAWADTALEACHRLGPLFERLGADTAAARSRELSRRLSARRPKPIAPTIVHGDFYHHQVLVDGDRIGIVDFDEATCDDPRVDAGNFLAHLDLERLRFQDDVEAPGDAAGGERDDAVGRHAEALAEAFLTGYAAAGAPISGLSWFRAAALARLALVPFRNLRPAWPERAEALLHRALEVVA